ncbi:MAG: prepilin-type N-terminal cleavage/methylation domain-containing protein [candidate division Zixibacteria bacterium]|nr:prepilin-type N-terminal cleavage/methylation domain-containing protein [candidate division Zixibacteria bacterium]
MMTRLDNSRGFTLIELVIVILVIGVLGSIATLKMNESIETAQYEQTKQELDNLAFAITGNPDLFSNGTRVDFGFVGDNGTLPANLDYLVTDPGGWSTWDGPYIERGLNSDDFKKDAWNVNYTMTDTLIRSTGSGSNIDKLVANSSVALLSNTVSGWVVDASGETPQGTYTDSVTVRFGYPDGAGNLTYASTNLDSDGRFNYGNIPIGNHTLWVIFSPDTDTMTYSVTVYPSRDVTLDIVFPADLW